MLGDYISCSLICSVLALYKLVFSQSGNLNRFCFFLEPVHNCRLFDIRLSHLQIVGKCAFI